MKLKYNPFRRRVPAYALARRMTIIVILASLTFTIVTSAIQSFMDYRRETDLLEERLRQIEVAEIPSIINSLWHFDGKQMETQLQGILNLEDIRHVELQGVDGETYSSGDAPSAENSLSRTYPLVYKQGNQTFTLGRLQVIADMNGLKERVFDRLLLIIFTSAIRIFLLAGFILFVVDRLLTRPLNEIVKYTGTLDLDGLQKPLELTHRSLASPGDELDQLSQKINQMRYRLMEDINEQKRIESLLVSQNEELRKQGAALEQADAQTRRLNAQLEKRVKDRTQQLAALNQELESFSYSVAHDLRAPLRHLDGFSQIILEDHAGEINDEVKKWVLRIRESVLNMNQMVEALLSLSQVTRKEINITQVDLSQVAQIIADELHQHEPARQVKFDIESQLIVQADRTFIRIALENLINNAWKFTSQRPEAFIQFGRLKNDGFEQKGEAETVFFIRDNGAGFNMAFVDRLFYPFQRIHSAVEFSGTGIGLATVKRILQRHGGRIWAEGHPGQGATFFFTLS